MIYILVVLFIIIIFLTIQYKKDIKHAYERLNQYNINTLNTDYGKMTYIDEGFGETILISHGIFGGYDQGFLSLNNIVGDNYRKISPSRFGYPGSDLPLEPTPENQAIST